MTLLTLLRDHYGPLKGIDDRTVKIYEFTIVAFRKFLGRDPTLEDDLEELQVARFLAWRLKERSVGTAAKDRSTLRAMWEWAARRGLTTRWPTIRTIRVPERVPQAWLTDEMQRLLQACGGEEGMVGTVPQSRWFYAILLLGYEVGERIGGLLSLEWADVTPEGVIFRAEGRKGHRRDIWRGITPECYAAIQAIKTDDRRLVFCWDRTYGLIWNRLGKICERAGLPNNRTSKFHRVRKTTASYAQAGGLNAQEVMDHASPITTRRYLDPRIVKQGEAAAILPRVG